MARVQALAEGALFLIPSLLLGHLHRQQEIMPDMKTSMALQKKGGKEMRRGLQREFFFRVAKIYQF